MFGKMCYICPITWHPAVIAARSDRTGKRDLVYFAPSKPPSKVEPTVIRVVANKIKKKCSRVCAAEFWHQHYYLTLRFVLYLQGHSPPFKDPSTKEKEHKKKHKEHHDKGHHFAGSRGQYSITVIPFCGKFTVITARIGWFRRTAWPGQGHPPPPPTGQGLNPPPPD